MAKYSEVIKPYENFHSCRLREPNLFQEDSFRRVSRDHDGKEYFVIMGKLKGETTMTEQAYRYSKDTWTASEAKAHCKDHDGTFEAAKGKCFQEAGIDPDMKFYDSYASKKFEPKIETVQINGEEKKFGRVPWRLTSLKVDRIGEVVKPDGIRLEEFKKNPVVLYSHDAGWGGTLPIGKLDIDSIVITNKYVDADILFNLNEDFARSVFELVQLSIINSGSIGFRPFAISDEPLLEGQTGKSILEWELLEFSVVPIPMNSEAVRKHLDLLDKKIQKPENKELEIIRKNISTMREDDIPVVERFLSHERDKRNFMIKSTPMDLGTLTQEVEFNLRTMLDIMIQKEGRVISTANLNKLRNAHEMIGEVLNAAEKKPPAEPEKEKDKKQKESKKPKYNIVRYDSEKRSFII